MFTARKQDFEMIIIMLDTRRDFNHTTLYTLCISSAKDVFHI